MNYVAALVAALHPTLLTAAALSVTFFGSAYVHGQEILRLNRLGLLLKC